MVMNVIKPVSTCTCCWYLYMCSTRVSTCVLWYVCTSGDHILYNMHVHNVCHVCRAPVFLLSQLTYISWTCVCIQCWYIEVDKATLRCGPFNGTCIGIHLRMWLPLIPTTVLRSTIPATPYCVHLFTACVAHTQLLEVHIYLTYYIVTE